MITRKYFAVAFLFAAALLVPALSTSAQEMMKKEEAKPFVAVIKADWCTYCKRVEPVVSALMKEYGEKLEFVVFDVTDDAAIMESKKKAKMLGLDEFFMNYQKKTSTVAVIKAGEITFKTSNNTKRSDYVTAFDAVLK